MKMSEYFATLPVGEVVNKRGLAYLKRLGLIWDYSPWGYLESLHIFGARRLGEQWADDMWLEVSPNRKCKGAADKDYSEMTFKDMLDYFGCQGHIELNGVVLRPKYLSGCFKPYLVKDGPSNGKEVNRSMSLWGAVC